MPGLIARLVWRLRLAHPLAVLQQREARYRLDRSWGVSITCASGRQLSLDMQMEYWPTESRLLTRGLCPNPPKYCQELPGDSIRRYFEVKSRADVVSSQDTRRHVNA